MNTTDKPTLATHRYYRSVVLPRLREYCGHESDAEMHVQLKSAFYDRSPLRKLPSMADMTRDESTRFVDYAIRQAAELGLVLPEPRKDRT